MSHVFILPVSGDLCVPGQGSALLCSCHREINSLSCHYDDVFKWKRNHFETHEILMSISILPFERKNNNDQEAAVHVAQLSDIVNVIHRCIFCSDITSNISYEYNYRKFRCGHFVVMHSWVSSCQHCGK